MQGCEGPAEFTLNCGMHEEAHARTWEAPEAVSPGGRTWAEYLDRESACSEVADALVVLGGRERLLHGKGVHGRASSQRKLVPDTLDRITQANLTARIWISNAGACLFSCHGREPDRGAL